MLRIEAILRRTGPRTAPPARRIKLGDCELRPRARRADPRGDAPVRLTEGEAQLLQLLAQNAHAPVDRLDLARETADATGRAVDVQVTRLRRKIEADPQDPALSADGPRRRLHARAGRMSAQDTAPAPAVRARVRRAARCACGPHLQARLPSTLCGRALLIIVLPVAVMQIAVTWVFFDAHWQHRHQPACPTAWPATSPGRPTATEADPTPQDLQRIADTRRPLHWTCRWRCSPAASCRRDRRARASPRSTGRCAPRWRTAWTSPSGSTRARYPAYVDIRVQVPNGVLRIIAARDRAFATQRHRSSCSGWRSPPSF